MAQVSFHNIDTWAGFTSLQSGDGSLIEGGLYFVKDRNIIMRATSSKVAEEYGGLVKLVDDFPSTGQKQGILYISGTSGSATGKMWNGSSWVVVFQPAEPQTVDQEVNAGDADAVSSVAVINYVDTYMSNNTTDGTSGSNANKIPKLDANGKLHNDFLPALAISEFLGTVDKVSGATSPDEDLTKFDDSANKGDWAKVDGDDNTAGHENGSYICTAPAVKSGNTVTTHATWQRLADKLDEVTNTISSGSATAVSSGAVFSALSWQPASST